MCPLLFNISFSKSDFEPQNLLGDLKIIFYFKKSSKLHNLSDIECVKSKDLLLHFF